jgi:hypothetical protein
MFKNVVQYMYKNKWCSAGAVVSLFSLQTFLNCQKIFIYKFLQLLEDLQYSTCLYIRFFFCSCKSNQIIQMQQRLYDKRWTLKIS